MEHLYYILDAFIAPGILLGMALCLFFLHIPPKSALRNYRRARYIMGSAYLLYSICIYLEYHVFEASDDNTLVRPIILTIACYQAFLFTHTFITLLRLNFISTKRLIIEASIITLMSIALFFFVLKCNSSVAQWAFGVYVVFYIALLAHYVFVFTHEYREYASQMDNYFSDEDTRRLHWVKRSFFISLLVGVLALLFALMPMPPVAILFMTVAIIFYAAFGVRFINYALHFHSIENAITTTANCKQDTMLEPTDLQLMQRIEDLMQQDKLFKKIDLSVGDLALRLDARPRQVSMVIAGCRQANFKTYINEYRIQEAKRLLDEDKANIRTIDAIASEAGFANRSSFYRVFKRSQGISPTDYRLSH